MDPEELRILCEAEPESIHDYSRHVSLLLQQINNGNAAPQVVSKFTELASKYSQFIPTNILERRGWVMVEGNFDGLLLAIEGPNLPISVTAIRLLTKTVFLLNYWEVYNILTWRPAIYVFMKKIEFNFTQCYQDFIIAYRNQTEGHPLDLRTMEMVPDSDDEEQVLLPSLRIVPRHALVGSTKLLNYDPDVIHECQLPQAENAKLPCLRRFSRKYELIRHQETVHSKKKKLFKCFVCVKQNPQLGPRVFTRHDTLAKHIRVNHKILGLAAKEEVAYLKKHAEVVDEDEIRVQVGRRKSKVEGDDKKEDDEEGFYLE